MPKTNKFIFWIPRISAILFIMFLAIFSLDVFEENYGFWETFLGLFIHNIPSLILLVVLLVSWKYEIVGAIAFILAGILYIAWVLTKAVINGFEWYYLAWIIQISGISFFTGILFLICWKQKRKIKSGRN